MKKEILIGIIFLLSITFVNAISTTDLIAYYSFDSDCFTDEFSTFDLAVGGSPVTDAESMLGTSCYMDGTDYLSSTALVTAYPATTAKTLTGWMKKLDTVQQSWVSVSACNANNEYWWGNYRTADNWRHIAGANLKDSATGVSQENWHFFAFSIDDDGKIQHTYIDGTDLGTSVGSTVANTGLDTYIIGGNCYLSATIVQRYNGYVDEYAVWNKVLSDAEILELYNSGIGYNPIAPVVGNFSLNTGIINNTNSTSTPFEFVFNGSVSNTPDNFNCTMTDGTTLIDSFNELPINNTNRYLNLSNGNGEYNLNITCVNNESISDSIYRTVFIDTIQPKINIIGAFVNNSFYRKGEDTLSIKVNFSDTNLEAFNFSIFRLDENGNRENLNNNTFVQNILIGEYIYNFTDSLTNANWQNIHQYELNLQAWDGHTANNLRSNPTKTVNTLYYEGIKFYCDKTLSMNWEQTFDSIKPIIEFTTPAKRQTCYYETNNKWTKVKRIDDKLSLWYVDLANKIWIDEKYNNVETNLLSPQLLQIVYIFDQPNDFFRSESFGDLNFNELSYYFDVGAYTTYYGNKVPIINNVVDGEEYMVISNFTINTTAEREFFVKFVTNSKKDNPAGTNILYFNFTVNNKEIFEGNVRSMTGLADIGVSGFYANFTVPLGTHTITLYGKETGTGSVELSNIDYTALNLKTQNGEAICQPIVENDISDFTSTSYTPFINFVKNIGYESKLMLQQHYTVNASGTDTIYLYTQHLEDLDNSTIIGRYLSSSTSLGSMLNSYIDPSFHTAFNITTYGKSNNGNTITVNQKILGFCLNTINGTEINHKYLTNNNTDGINTLTLNAGINTIINDSIIIKNGTALFVESSFTFQSQSGAQTPTFNVSSGSCSNIKYRYLSSNSDIGNAFMICKLNGFAVGDTVPIRANIEVQTGETLTLIDEVISVIEIIDQDLTNINVPPTISWVNNLEELINGVDATVEVYGIDLNDNLINLTAKWYVNGILKEKQFYNISSGGTHIFTFDSGYYTTGQYVNVTIISGDFIDKGNKLYSTTQKVIDATTTTDLLLQELLDEQINTKEALTMIGYITLFIALWLGIIFIERIDIVFAITIGFIAMIFMWSSLEENIFIYLSILGALFGFIKIYSMDNLEGD